MFVAEFLDAEGAVDFVVEDGGTFAGAYIGSAVDSGHGGGVA